MPTRAIATSTLWQLGSQAVMAILSAITVKLVAIGLSQDLAGSYNSAYGYLQLFAILADFGLYAVSVRELSASSEKERVLGSLLVLRLSITILSLGTAVIIAWVVPAWRGTPLPIGISIAAFVPFFTLLAGVLRTIFQITYSMHLVFIAEVLQRVLTAGLMVLIILSGVRQSSDTFIYELFLWVGAAGSLLLLVLSGFFAAQHMRIRPVFDPTLLLSLLRKAMPYGAAFLCIALYRQFDLTMIALLREDFRMQNAMYGFAMRVSEMTYLVPTFLLNSTLPVLSERHTKGEPTASLLGKTLLFILLFGSVSSLFSFFWARPLMQLLTTDAYLSSVGQAGSDTALSFLSIPMFLNGLVLFSFYILLTRHLWKPLVLTMFIAVLLSLGLNLFLIPTHGFIGAIRTLTIVHLFLAVTLLPQAIRAMPVHLEAGLFLRWAFFTCIVGTAAWLTAPFLVTIPTIIVGLFCGAVGIGLFAFLLGFHRVMRSS